MLEIEISSDVKFHEITDAFGLIGSLCDIYAVIYRNQLLLVVAIFLFLSIINKINVTQ